MPMIDVKKAVKTASQYINGLYRNDISGLRVEEVDLDENEDWLITISFVDLNDLPPERLYKTLEIDSETGEVLAMRIREV